MAVIETLERRLFLSAGEADPTFGVGGLVTVGPYGSRFNDTKVLPDGKILAAGDVYPIQSNTISTTNKGLLLARFLPDGSPDPTFGNAGQEIVTAGGFIGGSRIALLPDGRFYVAGNTLGRFNPDGSFDTTFGDGGVAPVNSSGSDQAGVVLQPDGKILFLQGPLFDAGMNLGLISPTQPPAQGQTQVTFGYLHRFLPDGSPDNTFGSSDTVDDFRAGNTNWRVAAPTDVTMQSDKIIISLALAWPDPTNPTSTLHGFGAERLNLDGSPDLTFGTNGVAAVNYSEYDGNNGDVPSRVKIAPDGSIYESGYAGTGAEFRFVNFNPDGTSGTDHLIIRGYFDAMGSDLVFQPDGRVIVFGAADYNASNDLPYAKRLNPDLSADPTYGPRPITEIRAFGPGGADLDSFGRLVGAGERGNQAALVRLLGDAPTGTLIGEVAEDSNHNGQLDDNETVTDEGGGRVVYADLNGNGQFDPGEPSALTERYGDYTMDLPPGTYTIREKLDGYFLQELPANNGGYQVSVNVGQTVSVDDFLVAQTPAPPTAGNSPPASNPPPVSAPPPTIDPPPSSTPEATETLAGDRAAVQQAQATYRNSLRTQTRQIHADSRLLAAARKALRRAQRHIAGAGSVDPNLQDDVNQLEQTLDTDKATLASLRLTGLTAIRAARLKLLAFLHASRRANR